MNHTRILAALLLATLTMPTAAAHLDPGLIGAPHVPDVLRAEETATLALAILCPGGEANPQFTCQQVHGNYGVGLVRPCRAAWWSTAAPMGQADGVAPFLSYLGVCDRLGAANLTLAVAHYIVDPLAP